MKANKCILSILLLLSIVAFGQTGDEKLIYGKIVSDTISGAGVNVINLVTEQATVSNEIGRFSIKAKVGDLLFFGSDNFEPKRKLLEEADFKKDILVISLFRKKEEKITALDEVVVRKTGKSDDLNLHHDDHRDFTPAERKLYGARSGPVDILVNWLSGRTSQLKKELMTEMNERLLERVYTLYEPEYYTTTLKIPEDYVPGFQYFMIADADFVNAMKAKNKTLMRFHVSRLAFQYLELIRTEKK